jgi:hypothetical protein
LPNPISATGSEVRCGDARVCGRFAHLPHTTHSDDYAATALAFISRGPMF